jgi:hypothetical protein
MEETYIDRLENGPNANIRSVDDCCQELIMKLTNETERYDCFLLLTAENKHSTICQQTYDEKYIKAFIENSTHFQLYKKKDTKEIVGFNLLKLKKNHKMDVILTCAVANTNHYGKMLAFGAYRFAIRNKVKKILAAPRTPALRATFVRNGFVTCFGTEDIDEVLEKEVSSLALKSAKTNKTRHVRRTRPHYHRNEDDTNAILQSNAAMNKATLKNNKRSGRYTLKAKIDSLSSA